MKLHKEIREALEETGLPWEIITGSRHFKIVLAGRLVGIISKGSASHDVGRGRANTVAQIRRAARQEVLS